jgi:hypothetical protein
MKDLGEAECILGIQIRRHKGKLTIDQSQFAKKKALHQPEALQTAHVSGVRSSAHIARRCSRVRATGLCRRGDQGEPET